MVSANDKGKNPEEDDPHKPKEEEISVGYEGYMEEDKQPDTRTTVVSIGVVAKPIKLKRTARMSTGGKSRHALSPQSPPPSTKKPFHTLIHERQYQYVPKGKLPSMWDMPRSNHAGEEHTKKEDWGKNNRDWNSRSDMIMNHIEQNSDLIRTLTFEIEELRKLI